MKRETSLIKPPHAFALLLLILWPYVLQAQVGVKFFKDYAACSYGVLDSISGDTLYEEQFTFYEKNGNHFIVDQNGAKGIVSSKNGKLLVPCKYSALQSMNNSVSTGRYDAIGNWYYFKEGEWWGLLHVQKGIIIPAQLADPRGTLTGRRTNKRQNCYFDTLGTVMCFEKYDDVMHGRDYFILYRNNFQFVADKKGELIVNDSFNQVEVLDNHHFFFVKDSLKGFYSGNGKLFYTTHDSIESLNYRNERIKYDNSNVVIIGGDKWAYLNTANKELQWTLNPGFKEIIDSRFVGSSYMRHLYKAIDSEGKLWFVDGINNEVLVSKVDKLHFDAFEIEEQKSKQLEYKLYYLTEKRLFSYESQTKKHELIAAANDFETYYGHLFVKMRKKWFYYSDVNLKALRAQDLYFHTSNNVFLFRKHDIVVFDSHKEEMLNYHFNEIFTSPNRVDAIGIKGNLLRFQSGSVVALENRFETISQEQDGAIKQGIFDTLENSLLFYPEFDTVIIADNKMAYLMKNGEKALYDLIQKKFIVNYHQYPVIELKPELGWFRYGNDSSSCIYLFDGTEISHWQDIMYFESFDEHSYFAASDVQAMGLLDKNNPAKWLVKPAFCAIKQYDYISKTASVRDCPIDTFEYYGYWDIPYNNQEGLWGIIDSIGDWIIESISHYPMDLGKPQQFILTNEGYQLWDINGQQLWPETYAFVDTFDQVENAFWVGDDFMNRGIKKLEGSFLIDTQYNWLKQVGDTIYGAKWKVNPDFEEKDEGWQLPSGKQDLSQIQLFYFDENWNPRSITGYAKFKFISENFDMEWEPELYGYQLNKPNYEPFCLWALKRFLGTNKVQDNWAIGNDWQPAYFGTTLPKYRIPTEVVYYGPRYVDYSYHNIFIGSTVYGAAATIESNSGTIGPGAMGYTNSQFYNLVIDGDSVHNLKLWDVLDKKCIYVLNDTLAHKLKAKEIDVDCGKDGLVVYSLMEHFKVNDSSLAFLIKKGEYYENNYVSLKINLNDWPLTPYFIEKRKQFGQR